MQFRIGLYYLKEAPKTLSVTIAMVAANLYIRPNEKNHIVRDSFVIPVDVEAFRILAHAHLLCRSVKTHAMLPNGTNLRLLTISDWNVNWQLPYTFAKPLRLPAGTRIEMEFTYDNSSPPPGSVFNATVVEEMAYLQIQAAPERMEDLPKLRQAILAKQQETRRQRSN